MPEREAAVVVHEHQPDAPAGLIGEWLDARGIAWWARRGSGNGDRPPSDAGLTPGGGPAEARRRPGGGPAAIVSLGSSDSAYADLPWVHAEQATLRRALADDTPVLGICFGAQALAAAAGGSVARAEQSEVGWVAVQSDEPAIAGDWLAWHHDRITLPADARELARSPRAVQAYRVGRSLGLQFHPEVTPAIWRGWSDHDPDTVRAQAGDPNAVSRELEARAADLRARLFALLDWWRADHGAF